MVQVTGERIAKRVKRLFGDESGVQVTNDDVIDWLNDAMVEAAVQNGSINIQRRYAPALEGFTEVTLPDSVNLAAVHTVSYRNGSDSAYTPLTFISFNQFEQLFPDWNKSKARGCPEFYTTASKGRFYVYPAPSVDDGLGYSVLYNSFFSEVTDLLVTMDISPRYFQYLLEYCLMKAYEMDENWEAADRKASFIQSTLNSLASSDSDLNQSKYPSVAVSPEDM